MPFRAPLPLPAPRGTWFGALKGEIPRGAGKGSGARNDMEINGSFIPAKTVGLRDNERGSDDNGKSLEYLGAQAA
jgi:hypothetical protein